MRDYLIFTLAAAMGSMGELAGHERRGTWTWPGRSAILGLLGAASGLRRGDDFSDLDKLRVAVAVFEDGAPLRDYHTVQTVPTAAAKRPQSRPAAMAEAGRKVNTTITQRDYRTGPLYGAAIWGEGLQDLRDALQAPTFTLHLGRKSCPLSAPVCPQIVPAETPEDALGQLVLPQWHDGTQAHLLASDDGPAERIEIRNDVPIDRHLWHFGPRSVHLRQVRIAPDPNPRWPS